MVLCAAVVGDHAKTGVVALLRQAVMIINGFPVLPRQAIMTKGGTFTLQGDDPLPTPVRPAATADALQPAFELALQQADAVSIRQP
jgi:hypothetical protein